MVRVSVNILFLSLDEILALHEHLILITINFLKLSGYWEKLSGFKHVYWVIPYGLALIFLTIAYSKFLFRLPRNIFRLMVIAGLAFVSGAIGFDVLGHRQWELHGRSNLPYVLLYTVEEFLEMLEVIIFIYALTTYKSIIIKID